MAAALPSHSPDHRSDGERAFHRDTLRPYVGSGPDAAPGIDQPFLVAESPAVKGKVLVLRCGAIDATKSAALVDEGRAATLARGYLAARRRRAELFSPGLFADPAWDMMLDLFAARIEGKRVSVSSACIASGVATSTALRWLAELERLGLVVRCRDELDRRRTFVEIDGRAVDTIRRWLSAAFF